MEYTVDTVSLLEFNPRYQKDIFEYRTDPELFNNTSTFDLNKACDFFSDYFTKKMFYTEKKPLKMKFFCGFPKQETKIKYLWYQ